MSTECDALEAEGVHDGHNIRGVVGHSVAAIGFVAETPPTQVEGQHPRGARQAGPDQVVEQVGVAAQAVKKQQRLARSTMIDQVEPQAVNLDEAGAAAGHLGIHADLLQAVPVQHA